MRTVHPPILGTSVCRQALFYWRFRLFSGLRGQVEAATVEVDRVHEVQPVPEAPRRVLHPLDLGIDGFAGRVGDPMPQVRDDVLEASLENIITYLRHRITNATSESINAKIQWVKYTARGFRNRLNFVHAIYFHCGGLDLAPQSTK